MHRTHHPRRALTICLLPWLGLAASFAAPPAFAVLDIDDRGPVLDPGGYQLRVTNAGIVGNAFFDVGRSGDPSFEVPPGSGQEALRYLALWVGGRLDDGTVHVSGGPLLEFRPTPEPDDRVRIWRYGRLGAIRFVDDDNDGRIDEEWLDGRDDDGDGEVDEDLGTFSQQMAAARFQDDRPEAVNYSYPNGEAHVPLGIEVKQQVYAWSVPGYDRAAGLSWVIENHGDRPVTDLYVGLFADLDSKLREEVAGHLNDRVLETGYQWTVVNQPRCRRFLRQPVKVIADADTNGTLPWVALVPLWHTIDPVANFDSLFSRPVGHAPRTVGFRSQVFEVGGIPGQGGPPLSDDQRYLALQGELPGSPGTRLADYAVLVSCGPFPRLDPGETIELHAALVAAPSRDTLAAQIANLALLEYGIRLNLEPDVPGPPGAAYLSGESGIAGHEVCLEVRPDVELVADPHCPRAWIVYTPDAPVHTEMPQRYPHDRCVWTDADCDVCTGNDGRETEIRWGFPGLWPAPPAFRPVALDGRVRLEWNNYPEVLLAGIPQGWSETRFLGYRVWRASDWSQRTSLLPGDERWSLVAAFGDDSLYGMRPLASVTDSTLDYERVLFEQKLYPVGRYAWEDSVPLNGFDYLYFVSAAYELRLREPDGYLRTVKVESPIEVTFGQRVVPHAAAEPSGGRVHVVPNPYRGGAAWERRAVYGDARTRHVDFVGLPRARCTIRVWTVAGDLVAQIDHDASGGDGEAPWDLISRNGQDVASGIYLFTVDSTFGMQRGRFVVIR